MANGAETSVPLRVLYLQRLYSINGRDALTGRHLFDRFRATADECLLGHLVVDALPEKLDKDLGTDLVPRETFSRLRPNVVFLEGGLFAADGEWRLERQLAEEFVRQGGVFIVADVEINQLYDDRRRPHYDNAVGFFGSRFSYDSFDQVIHLIDKESHWGGFKEIVCDPREMTISDWVRPVYDGISKVVVGGPLKLSIASADLIASGNRETVQASSRRYGDDMYESDLGIFAVANKIGTGYAVLIAGAVSADAWVEPFPDNIQWLVNVASFLVNNAESDRRRSAHHLTSKHVVFLSHRSIDKQLVADVSNALKRRGLGTWLDRDRILPSDSFVQEIGRGLDAMTEFTLFWSQSCVGAPWVERELNIAVTQLTERRIPIIVIRLDSTPVPTIISDLHRIEAVGMSAEEIAKSIADAIKRRAERV